MFLNLVKHIILNLLPLSLLGEVRGKPFYRLWARLVGSWTQAFAKLPSTKAVATLKVTVRPHECKSNRSAQGGPLSIGLEDFANGKLADYRPIILLLASTKGFVLSFAQALLWRHRFGASFWIKVTVWLFLLCYCYYIT